MVQKGRAMKNKKQKPTLKEVVGEVNYLGGRLIQLENVVRNTVTGKFETKDWWKLLKKKARSGFKNLAVLDTRLFD